MFVFGILYFGIYVLICGFLQGQIIVVLFSALQGIFGSVLIFTFSITKYYYGETEQGLELAYKFMTICI